MNIVLVGAKRFCNVKFGEAIEMGDILTVEDEGEAETLLSRTYRDKADNEHPIFLPADDKPGIQYYLEGWGEEEEPKAAPAKAAKKPRKPAPRRARAAS